MPPPIPHAARVTPHDDTELKRAQTELMRSQDVLRRLAAGLDSVQENERRRIASELHDDLQQTLGAIRMNLVAVTEQLAAFQHRVPPLLAEVDMLVANALESTRRIVSDLRPAVLEDLGLAAALTEICAGFTRRTGIDSDLDIQDGIDEEPAITPAISFCLYRVVQESLNNVAKHAQANTVQIGLRRAPDDQLVLRITDNGRGLREEDREKKESFGLIGMQERLRAIGGTLRVTGKPGQGTTVEATVPFFFPAA